MKYFNEYVKILTKKRCFSRFDVYFRIGFTNERKQEGRNKNKGGKLWGEVKGKRQWSKLSNMCKYTDLINNNTI